MKKLFYSFMVLSLVFSFAACGGSNNSAEQPEQEQTQQQALEFVLPDEERNTSDMVDAIEKLGKEHAEIASDAYLQTAFDFIKDNYPDYYADDDMMEKAIYYGRLLECAYKDKDENLSNLGWKTIRSTKYVYRNVDTIDADATQINLESIGELLDTLDN